MGQRVGGQERSRRERRTRSSRQPWCDCHTLSSQLSALRGIASSVSVRVLVADVSGRVVVAHVHRASRGAHKGSAPEGGAAAPHHLRVVPALPPPPSTAPGGQRGAEARPRVQRLLRNPHLDSCLGGEGATRAPPLGHVLAEPMVIPVKNAAVALLAQPGGPHRGLGSNWKRGR